MTTEDLIGDDVHKSVDDTRGIIGAIGHRFDEGTLCLTWVDIRNDVSFQVEECVENSIAAAMREDIWT